MTVSASSAATDQPSASRNRLVLMVYTAAIFVSALLLFSVQPLFTKMVLPRLGGSPAVWSVAMVFFQSLLLAGYAYAHFLMQIKSRAVPIAVFAVIAFLTLLYTWTSYSAIIGYGWLGLRLGQGDDLHNGGADLAGGKRFVRKTTAIVGANSVSTTELVVDATPSGGPSPSTGKNDFLHSPNSGMGMTDYTHSGHMTKTKPDGGNILFVDGHASWRRFAELGAWYETNDREVFFWF